ncbi:prolyl-tRNA synthetase [Caloramator quimbayensis]|uniref:Proline--tRNA ligase n=1 Tax=Caloramator quimbayensis TaxID=1147123 RepID=A0A1T4Y2Q9_9CLOT|nr:proline--tRNA ligase [Caloramator quimbayensis]SKA96046.1 prolyl-tRNA synthetase [Caloramator quimbayensis]
MKYSEYFIPTLKEAIGNEENESVKLMIRAGLIRKVVSGVYFYMPAGYKILNKIESLLREEMKSLKANEILNPKLIPLELSLKEEDEDENICFKDRNGRGFSLGTNYEKLIFDILKSEIKSYKSLPLMLYSIDDEFRDERRPRAGLLRAREFKTFNIYSFNKLEEDFDESFGKMDLATKSFLKKVNLESIKVRCDYDPLDKIYSYDYVVESENGDYNYVNCENCGYKSAKDYTAVKIDCIKDEDNLLEMKKISTPDVRTIDELVSFLNTSAKKFAKTLIYTADEKTVAVMVRGDREVNENKVKKYLNAKDMKLADEETILKVTNAQVGFAGPVGIKADILLVDNEITYMRNIVVGANDTGYHLINVNYGRDFEGIVGDFRNITQDDLCPVCGSKISIKKGIKVASLNKNEYDSGIKYRDEKGEEKSVLTALCSIGISRVMSAVSEISHDDRGILWPFEIAPFKVDVIIASVKDELQVKVAHEIYNNLKNKGIDVLMDDRDERAGVKFNDADLLGIPVRITVGKKVKDGFVEVKLRSEEISKDVKIEDVLSELNYLG